MGVGGFVTVSLEEPEDRFPSKHPTDLRQIKKKEKRKCQRGVKSARLCRRPCCRDDVMQKSFSNSSAALTRVDVRERDCVGLVRSGIKGDGYLFEEREIGGTALLKKRKTPSLTQKTAGGSIF